MRSNRKAHITNMGIFTSCGKKLKSSSRMFIGVGRIKRFRNACKTCLRTLK